MIPKYEGLGRGYKIVIGIKTKRVRKQNHEAPLEASTIRPSRSFPMEQIEHLTGSDL